MLINHPLNSKIAMAPRVPFNWTCAFHRIIQRH